MLVLQMHERVMLGVQVGYPDRGVLPGQFDWAMLGTVIMTSFLGQMLLNRAFQISNASKASSINCVQVCSSESFKDMKAHVTKKGRQSETSRVMIAQRAC